MAEWVEMLREQVQRSCPLSRGRTRRAWSTTGLDVAAVGHRLSCGTSARTSRGRQ
ncbi:hypothetical protein QJS66_06175 [Kocuria rhizophila]|nr:hypothetical protein QJS66_06175 [Kocuria rhizophila]